MRELLTLFLFCGSSLAFAAGIGSAPQSVVTAGDMSGTVTSSTVPVFGIDNVNCQAVFTGTPTGTFAINVSLDGTNWTPLTLSPALAASGAAGNWDQDLNQMGASYFQIVYTRTGGTGTLNILCYAKHV